MKKDTRKVITLMFSFLITLMLLFGNTGALVVKALAPSHNAWWLFLLLCTDGLTNMAEPEEIAAIIAMDEVADKDSLKDSAEKLISLANDRGGADNITAVILAY